MGNARYTVILEWDADEELYIATIPALSIGSYGSTRQEALQNVTEAAEVTIEGLKATGQAIPKDDESVLGHIEVAV